MLASSALRPLLGHELIHSSTTPPTCSLDDAAQLPDLQERPPEAGGRSGRRHSNRSLSRRGDTGTHRPQRREPSNVFTSALRPEAPNTQQLNREGVRVLI